VPTPALSRLYRRLLQTLCAAGPETEAGPVPADFDADGRFLEPFWRRLPPGDELASEVATSAARPEPSGAAAVICRAIGALRCWAEANQRSAAFWRTLWGMVPVTALGPLRFRRLGWRSAAADPRRWVRLIAPLQAAMTTIDRHRLDEALFGSELRLSCGLDGRLPVFLSCRGQLTGLADRIVDFEARRDPGMPDMQRLRESECLAGTMDELGRQGRAVRAQQPGFYSEMLSELPCSGACAHALRAYCHHCLETEGGLGLIHAERAVRQAPGDPHIAALWVSLLPPPAPGSRSAAPAAWPAGVQATLCDYEHTWSALSSYHRRCGRDDLAMRYLRSLHCLWPWDPLTTSWLSLLASFTGDDPASHQWSDLTTQLDTLSGPYSQFVMRWA
jgi:hypothetical protein